MSVSDLIDLLAFMAVYAPDEFPDEEEDTLDLPSAFSELYELLEASRGQIGNDEVVSQVAALFGHARELYDARNDSDANSELIKAQYILRGLKRR